MGNINYCPLNFDTEKFKFIGDILTKKETTKVNNTIQSSCGGFLLDSDIFKLDKDKENNQCITLKGTEKITDSLIPNCGGIRLDKAIFQITDNKITLVEQPVLAKTNVNEIPSAKVKFDSIEDFTVQVIKDGEVVEPISDKEYFLEKNTTYEYEAINGENVVKGTITPKRRNNITETITF